jgi:hypothetical protein
VSYLKLPATVNIIWHDDQCKETIACSNVMLIDRSELGEAPWRRLQLTDTKGTSRTLVAREHIIDHSTTPPTHTLIDADYNTAPRKPYFTIV